MTSLRHQGVPSSSVNHVAFRVLAKQSPCVSLWDDDVTSRGFMSQIGALSVTWMLYEEFVAIEPTQNATGLQRTLQRTLERTLQRTQERTLQRTLEHTLQRTLQRTLERTLQRTLERTLQRTLQRSATECGCVATLQSTVARTARIGQMSCG